MNSQVSTIHIRTCLGTVQYLLKGRAGGKEKFHEKNFLPFVLSNEKNVLPCYLTLGKNVDALLLCHNFLPRFIP
jgi:hypothetical protein